MQDRWAKYRSAHDIKQIVRDLLEQAGFAGRRQFNVVQLFQWLASKLKSGIDLALYDQQDDQPPQHMYLIVLD